MAKRPNNKDFPVRVTMCPTCPFRPGSKYAYLRDDLAESAMTSGRICHSTGSNNAINTRTGFPAHLCRGAREVQLNLCFQMGVITEPTDEAWNDKREEIGLPRQVIADPVKEGRDRPGR